MCMYLARGGVGVSVWIRRLGLSFSNPVGTGGVLDMCFHNKLIEVATNKNPFMLRNPREHNDKAVPECILCYSTSNLLVEHTKR